MLLADLNLKVVHGISDKITAPKKCGCCAASKVNGQCMFGGRCNEANLIYKATYTIFGKHYIGRTQNDMKTHVFKHITDVGRFWSKQKQLNHSVGLGLEEIIDDARSAASAPAAPTITTTEETHHSARSCSKRTRSSVRAQNPNPQSASQSAMNFSQQLQSQTPLASINENDIDDTASAISMDDFSTNSPSLADYLRNSLTLQSNQTSVNQIVLCTHMPRRHNWWLCS